MALNHEFKIDDIVKYVDRGGTPQEGVLFNIYEDGYTVLSYNKSCLDPVRLGELEFVGTAQELAKPTKTEWLEAYPNGHIFIDY